MKLYIHMASVPSLIRVFALHIENLSYQVRAKWRLIGLGVVQVDLSLFGI